MGEPVIGATAAARLARSMCRATVAPSPKSRAAVAAIGAAGRAESRAAAARLDAISALFGLRTNELGGRADWAVDTTDVVASEVSAELRVSRASALSLIRYARAMNERLPRVAAVFRAGDLDLQMFKTIVFRTDLIIDPLVLSFVDAALSYEVGAWTALTRKRLRLAVDKVIARADRDAIRLPRNPTTELGVWVHERPGSQGLADVSATVTAPTAAAIDQRVAALAATVCDHDPRTLDVRREAALQAMAMGADRLACQCGDPNCPAGAKPQPLRSWCTSSPPPTPSPARVASPGWTWPPPRCCPRSWSPSWRPPHGCVRWFILATPHPNMATCRRGGWAAFVRARDLTCRAPGCDKPATACDLDHTVPYGRGGTTCASNLKCLCRVHHLLKTFFGWTDEQLPDGTVIWTSPGGCRYVTTAGSAMLFPTLCRPTATMPIPKPTAPTAPPEADRTAMVPRRRRTRAQDRAARITTERRHNQEARCHYPPKPNQHSQIREPDPPPF